MKKQAIEENAVLYFNLDKSIEPKIKLQYEVVFKKVFSDSIQANTLNKLKEVGEDIINQFYAFGILSENYEFPDKRAVAILDGNIKQKDAFYSNLIEQNEVSSVIE